MTAPDFSYAASLSGERLRRCYEIAPPRVRRYLDAEIAFLLEHVAPAHAVLELGCGYGRVLGPLAGRARRVVGIDTARDSVRLGRALLGHLPNVELHEMNAIDMTFPCGAFDVVACVQNGVAAFGVNRRRLLREALRVTRPGGTVVFTSYAERFWADRLHWFRRQAEAGLLGPIDEQATGDGVIACADGLRLGTVGPEAFTALARACGVGASVTEVDGSSVCCVIRATGAT